MRKDSEQAVADQGERSVQPLGGDDPRVEATNTPDVSAPLTSTSKRGKTISTRNVQLKPDLNGFCSQSTGPGTDHAGTLGASGELAGI